MYAITLNGTVLTRRYPSWDDAVESAQGELALPPGADWSVVVRTSKGNFVPAVV